jgi:glycosyltransferase involved in cell wall biosynthesis
MTATLSIPLTRQSRPVADDAPAFPRRRVLISAYAVSPVRGSEAGMGWNIATRIARHHDVTLLCSPNVPPNAEDFRGEVEQYAREHGPIPGMRCHFVQPPLASYLFQRESRVMRRSLYYTGYKSWQRAAYRVARELHARQRFDLVHQLNITGFREPGYLWKLPNVPFVWGPVGGAANIPSPFLSLMSVRERWFYRLRNVTNAMQKRMLSRCRKAANRGSHIWVVGDANRRLVEETWGQTAEPMLEVGGEVSALGKVRTFDGSRRLNVVWSGQHIGRKALPLLLYALAKVHATTPVKLTVLGDGPETPTWKSLAEKLDVSPLLNWTGRVSREHAIREMSDADAFISTSVLEETSLVVLEALSLGLPVICHDACGMGVAVTDACGVKVPMRTPESSIAGFAQAIQKLSTAGAESFAKLSRGALDRARELSWDAKAAAMAQTYERVISTYSQAV